MLSAIYLFSMNTQNDKMKNTLRRNRMNNDMER